MLRMLRQDNIVELKEAFRRKGKLVGVAAAGFQIMYQAAAVVIQPWLTLLCSWSRCSCAAPVEELLPQHVSCVLSGMVGDAAVPGV
jgi:hypothetical protein